MVSIKWCCKQKLGLRLIEPNENMAQSYMGMAEESIRTLQNLEQSKIWTAATSYYIFYYSLYAFMLRMGIKCEIHSCSLEFMKQYLQQFCNSQDVEMIKKAFSARNDLQYYADRPVDEQEIQNIKKGCKSFFIKTKDILSKITTAEIDIIRGKLLEITKPQINIVEPKTKKQGLNKEETYKNSLPLKSKQ